MIEAEVETAEAPWFPEQFDPVGDDFTGLCLLENVENHRSGRGRFWRRYGYTDDVFRAAVFTAADARRRAYKTHGPDSEFVRQHPVSAEIVLALVKERYEAFVRAIEAKRPSTETLS